MSETPFARVHPPGLLSCETYTTCDAPLLPGRRDELAALLALCDVFSPNEGEARSMLGQPEPDAGPGGCTGSCVY